MLVIYLAKKEDFDFFYDIKNNEFNMHWTGYSKKPEYNQLKEFFAEKIENQNIESNRKIYIMADKLSGDKYGYMYLDPIDSDSAEVSIAVSYEYTKRGIGKKAVNSLIEIARDRGYKMLIAYIREDNVGSKRLFESVGFKRTEEHKMIHLKESSNVFSKEIEMNQYILKIK